MMKRRRDWGGVYGGGVFLISGQQIEQQQKITKKNTTKQLTKNTQG
jgi:hypothetical protein